MAPMAVALSAGTKMGGPIGKWRHGYQNLRSQPLRSCNFEPPPNWVARLCVLLRRPNGRDRLRDEGREIWGLRRPRTQTIGRSARKAVGDPWRTQEGPLKRLGHFPLHLLGKCLVFKCTTVPLEKPLDFVFWVYSQNKWFTVSPREPLCCFRDTRRCLVYQCLPLSCLCSTVCLRTPCIDLLLDSHT